MTQNFNLKRVSQLFRSTLITNKRGYVILLLIYSAIILIFASFDIARTWHQNLLFEHTGTAIKYLFYGIYGVSYQLMYSQYRNKLFINTTHLIPASTTEKFSVSFFCSLILIPMAFLLLIVVLLSFMWALAILLKINNQLYIGVIEGLNNYINTENMSITQALQLRIEASHYLETIQNAFFPARYDEPLRFWLPLLVPISLHSVAYLSTVMPKRYTWSPFCIWLISILLPTILFSSGYSDYKDYIISFLPYITLGITLIFWAIAYLKFKKIELSK